MRSLASADSEVYVVSRAGIYGGLVLGYPARHGEVWVSFEEILLVILDSQEGIE